MSEPIAEAIQQEIMVAGTVEAKGIQGDSAYIVALANGFEGSEAEWLTSLEGERGSDGQDGAPGIDGAPGADGADGAPGADGSDGADGKSAYDVAVDEGFVGNESAWLLTLKGGPGADGVDGADGTPGAPGAPGEPGADGAPGIGVPDPTEAPAGRVPTTDGDGGYVLEVPSGGGGSSLPDTSGASEGDVLSLDASLDPEWAPPSGGGGGITADNVRGTWSSLSTYDAPDMVLRRGGIYVAREDGITGAPNDPIAAAAITVVGSTPAPALAYNSTNVFAQRFTVTTDTVIDGIRLPSTYGTLNARQVVLAGGLSATASWNTALAAAIRHSPSVIPNSTGAWLFDSPVTLLAGVTYSLYEYNGGATFAISLLNAMGAGSGVLTVAEGGRFVSSASGALAAPEDVVYPIILVTALPSPWALMVPAPTRWADITANKPAASTVPQGTMFFDTTINKPLWSNGSVWKDATGTTV